MDHVVVVTLLVYTLLREILFYYQSQKLINKLMSRNYHEYRVTEQVGKPKPQTVQLKPELTEDLSQLGSYLF